MYVGMIDEKAGMMRFPRLSSSGTIEHLYMARYTCAHDQIREACLAPRCLTIQTVRKDDGDINTLLTP